MCYDFLAKLGHGFWTPKVKIISLTDFSLNQVLVSFNCFQLVLQVIIDLVCLVSLLYNLNFDRILIH